jgi:hypothetical protein
MNFDMNVVNKYMNFPRKVHLEALIKKCFLVFQRNTILWNFV